MSGHGAGTADPRDAAIERLEAELAGERARLERELAFARRIQLNLLPHELPRPAGWQVAAAYRAARAVGGDFYDAYALPGRRDVYGLAIADVTGKGLTAALLMAFTRAVLRAAAYNGRGVADALRRANRVLVRDARSGLFVTAIVAALDAHSGRVTYASAGHEPPLLLRAGRAPRELAAGGVMLGLLDRPPARTRGVTLAPGDALVLSTDGVTDAAGPDGRRLGASGLHVALRAAAGGSADELVRAVVEAVDRHAGPAEQADDLTVLVVRRTAGARQRVRGKPRSIFEVPGSGQRAVTTLARV